MLAVRPFITYGTLISKFSELEIAGHYLNVGRLPATIQSPIRLDNHPSFNLYCKGSKVYYKDFATGEHGGLFDLLMAMWKTDFQGTVVKVWKDMWKGDNNVNMPILQKTNKVHRFEKTTFTVETREWQPHDRDYWMAYGISLEMLAYADVFPAEYKILHKEGRTMRIKADRYAYAYMENKEGRRTCKLYQPFNKKYKWCNSHDGSVISLWRKVPEKGKYLVICSSVKDALCLWCNTRIPAIALQGEGYKMSDTAIKVLKERFENIAIFYDNDKAGIEDSMKLSQQTGFPEAILPPFDGGKDISDYYKYLNDKEKFRRDILTILKKVLWKEEKSRS